MAVLSRPLVARSWAGGAERGRRSERRSASPRRGRAHAATPRPWVVGSAQARPRSVVVGSRFDSLAIAEANRRNLHQSSSVVVDQAYGTRLNGRLGEHGLEVVATSQRGQVGILIQNGRVEAKG